MSLQEEIIQQLGVKPSIDPQEEIRRSVDFLKRYLKNKHKNTSKAAFTLTFEAVYHL